MCVCTYTVYRAHNRDDRKRAIVIFYAPFVDPKRNGYVHNTDEHALKECRTCGTWMNGFLGIHININCEHVCTLIQVKLGIN